MQPECWRLCISTNWFKITGSFKGCFSAGPRLTYLSFCWDCLYCIYILAYMIYIICPVVCDESHHDCWLLQAAGVASWCPRHSCIITANATIRWELLKAGASSLCDFAAATITWNGAQAVRHAHPHRFHDHCRAAAHLYFWWRDAAQRPTNFVVVVVSMCGRYTVVDGRGEEDCDVTVLSRTQRCQFTQLGSRLRYQKISLCKWLRSMYFSFKRPTWNTKSLF